MKYEHSYGNFSIPAPAIRDPFGAVEDATGELTVTHQVASHLLGEIERAIDLPRQLEKCPGSMAPEVLSYRLATLQTLASVVDQRLKDGIILLYAVIDNQDKAYETQRLAASEWNRALAKYRALRKVSDDMPPDTEGEDAAVDAWCKAMDYLVEEIPAPSCEALACKLELARERWDGFTIPDAWHDAFLADLKRLGRGAGHD